MNLSEIIPKSKTQVDALIECIDLTKNGYNLLFVHQDNRTISVKLKHANNGNVIFVISTHHTYAIYKNRVLVKSVDSDN